MVMENKPGNSGDSDGEIESQSDEIVDPPSLHIDLAVDPEK